MPYRSLRLLFVVASLCIMTQCSNTRKHVEMNNNGNNPYLSIDINAWGEGTEIRDSGHQLMDNPFGLLELRSGAHVNDSVLVIAVHGYRSEGYEWITGLKNLADNYGSLFFFRYDWERCPDAVAIDFAAEVKALAKQKSYEKIIIFGHSYGGVVVTFSAAYLGKVETEIHVIAAPLSGFPQLLDHCTSLKYDAEDKLIYPEWNPAVQVIQHKTVHAQDGAFRDLASDPQDIELPFSRVQELPPTMDGHRLGHNWSVTWVLDQYIGKPHRY